MDIGAVWHAGITSVSAHVVLPVATWLGSASMHDNAASIAEAILISLVQVCIIGGVFRSMEKLWPAEEWADRKAVNIDFQYTLIMLLGLFPMFSFFVLTPVAEWFGVGDAASAGESPWHLLHWMPMLDGHPFLRFLVYYLLYDLTYYWMHRVQHWIPWWWAMHSMHHSQRQLSCWANDRGCYLDGALQSFVLAGVGVVVGMEADEFAWMMLLGELVQNFSHANVRIDFGRIFERVFVDPKFHRLHHMRVDPARPNLHNCNFGQVFSIWDVIFRTALYGEPLHPTGVCDPVVDADNGRNLVVQQWHTLKRFWASFCCAAGWRPGDVAFGKNLVPVPSEHVDLHAMERMTATQAS